MRLVLFVAFLGAVGPGLGRAQSVAGRNIGRVNIVLTSVCDEVNDDGRRVAPACEPACVRKVWEWRFWFTNYNVDESFGIGEHQGIGIFGYEYAYDPRWLPREGPVRPPWPATAGRDDFEGQIQRPDESGPAAEVLRSALCAQPVEIHRRLIYNHGRTLAQRESELGIGNLNVEDFTAYGVWIDVIRDGRITVGPAAPDDWDDERSRLSQRRLATQRCVAAIEDGFCDAVCGNCSYVIPSDAIGERVEDVRRDRLDAFLHPEGAGGANMSYVRSEQRQRAWFPHRPGEPRELMGPDAIGAGLTDTTHRDPFTHCVEHRSYPSGRQGFGTEGLTTKATLATWDGLTQGLVVSGLYGHNSNTDAEAQYQAFLQCASAPEMALAEGCDVCGNRQRDVQDGGEAQWPCLDRTNTARAAWHRAFQHHDIDDPGLGALPEGNPMPVCRYNGKPVHGM